LKINVGSHVLLLDDRHDAAVWPPSSSQLASATLGALAAIAACVAAEARLLMPLPCTEPTGVIDLAICGGLLSRLWFDCGSINCDATHWLRVHGPEKPFTAYQLLSSRDRFMVVSKYIQVARSTA
jgi:hypothetical protein